MASVQSDNKKSSKAKPNDCTNVRYTRMKCIYHMKQRFSLPMPPRQLLITELADFHRSEIEDAVHGRTRPFHNIVRTFRDQTKKTKIFCSPLAFYVLENIIRVEIARGECFCKHVLYIDKANFYNLIRDTKVETLDIQVTSGSHDMFEFLALTLPGSWCRELRALNVVFADKVCIGPLGTLLKKSRGVSRLRVAHTTNQIIRVSDFVKNMWCLEELELNCRDNTQDGYLLDNAFIQWVVEQQKRTGAAKPFRSLKGFNTHFTFSAQEFINECVNLAHLPHNQTYTDYETLNEIRGRGGFDIEDPKNCINFEITPKLSKELTDDLFGAMIGKSKSYIQNFTSVEPTFRYFLIENALFRLIDSN